MHNLIIDASYNLVKVELSGMLTPGDVERYGADLKSRFTMGKLRPGYRMLLDVSKCCIQPQETIAAFQRHVAGAPKSERIAIVTGSSVIRMQVRRVMTQSYAKLFTDRAQAFHWLMQNNETGAA